MAELVSAAIVQETVGQFLSGLVQKYEEKEESNEKRNLERLEMAHIRLEAALETSNNWQITGRILENEQMEWEVKNSSLPNRIVHATKSFTLSIFKRNDNDLRRSIAQRFEWYADRASEFLRFIELGGTPHHHMPFESLVKNLFAGKELHHKIVRGNEYPLFQLWLTPIHNPVHGIDVSLTFIYLAVQLSESIDIVGIAVKCLELFAPHFKYGLLEPVIQFNLHCHVSLPMYRKQKTSLSEDLISLQDYPYLKAGIFFLPHGSLEDMLPANRSSELAAIVRKEQHFLHTDITLEQLEEIMLPKAIDYLRQNAEAMVYQMLWKSKHGFALIQVEKP
ncbi:hypothetical protein SETIT_2G067400v2 [Setaria italica]|uniref:Rx N-terminal domain-containing protein n=1 Tax=Setaria italica TaxID=4555 RepID=K4A0A9_SETIT|nr:hypothetical protein SETIT_2G067400v2 [Setaria italica]